MNAEINKLPEEWFRMDTSLNVPSRFHHPGCSEDKDAALYISRQQKGWSIWCFRCGFRGFKKMRAFTPEEALDHLNRSWHRPGSDKHWPMKLPRDFTTEIPPDGRAWLYNAGISDFDIFKYGFGYSKRHESVVLPIYENGLLVYVQRRYLGDDPKKSKYHNTYQQGRKDIFFKVLDTCTDHVVVVEDILSCIRVGEVSNCYALLSAHVPEVLIRQLQSEYKRIILWLDPDKWDIMGTLVMRWRDRGVDVRMVMSMKDPKKYLEGEIQAFIENYGGVKCSTQNSTLPF